jgi:hemimethylated DNA binding protein
VIIISGELARFSDGTGAWRIENSKEEDDVLAVRGALFKGTPEKPIWRFSNGIERHLVKCNVTASERAWAEVFHQFKDAQTQIRQRIWANIRAGDIGDALSLQATWVRNVCFPSGCSQEQQKLLALGRWHLPGVCFKHKRYGYRGMIIACEPWCAAPATWRSKQPFSATPCGPCYHCLVDERDRAGGQSTFVPEEDLEICHDATVEHRLIRLLFVHCEEIQGYLPIPKLADVLWKHWALSRPIWEVSQSSSPATAHQLAS